MEYPERSYVVGKVGVLRLQTNTLLSSDALFNLSKIMDKCIYDSANLFVLDMKNVESISREGVDILIECLNHAMAQRGNLVLCNLNARVYQVIRRRGGDKRLKKYRSVEQAIAVLYNQTEIRT